MGGAGAGVEALALPLLAATRAAALACVPWVGRGDRKAADAAAVEAMRTTLAGVAGTGRVVIGEGEKDKAPMLYAGEEVGRGGDPSFDLAVDPLEGTTYCARGQEGAIAVLAAAPAGALWATPGFYMDKLVVGAGARGVIDLTAPVGENLDRVAVALGKGRHELVVIVLAKPRHAELIAEIRAGGAGVVEIADGDVMGSLRALVPGGGADACLGIGGAPEGVITACAARLLGGEMQGRLAPQSDDERALLAEAGVDVDAVVGTEEMVAGTDCVFAATAVTDGAFLAAPRATSGGWRTRSLLITPAGGAALVDTLALPPDPPSS